MRKAILFAAAFAVALPGAAYAQINYGEELQGQVDALAKQSELLEAEKQYRKAQRRRAILGGIIGGMGNSINQRNLETPYPNMLQQMQQQELMRQQNMMLDYRLRQLAPPRPPIKF